MSPVDFDMNMAGVDNAVGFTSYTYDTVLDIYFAQARFYDQNDRRFTQVDPIKDGVNWYAYCGNSPTVFVDPSGLFAWNEDDDYWFTDFRGDVEKAGGSIKFYDNGLNNGWHVSIYGVSVTFWGWNDGIKGTATKNSSPKIRADIFYSTIVNEAKEMLFLTGHKAFGGWAAGALHMTLFMFVGEDSDYWNHNDFTHEKWGIRYAAVGGTQVEGTSYLGGRINYKTDTSFDTKVYPMQHLHSGEGMVEKIYTSMDNFSSLSGAKYRYNPLGWSNSSTYMRGLLNSVDITPTLAKDYWIPGWGTLLPVSDFGGRE